MWSCSLETIGCDIKNSDLKFSSTSLMDITKIQWETFIQKTSVVKEILLI